MALIDDSLPELQIGHNLSNLRRFGDSFGFWRFLVFFSLKALAKVMEAADIWTDAVLHP